MEDTTPQLGYHNYENATTRQNTSIKKIIFLAIALVLVIGIAYAVTQLIQSLGAENNENEEPNIAWAGDDSPLADIQFLTSNGLTYEQYTDFYHQLTDYFKEKHAEYKYVEYVYDTFDVSTSADDKMTDCVVEDTEGYEEDEMGFWSCKGDEFATTTMTMKLRADNEDEYTVNIEPDNTNNTVTIHLYGNDHEVLI
ncbi:hypothetical protein IK146_01855 [Candidatus Saccharibacteria bacterium]|nr:hypothetical protein [Candidatus Saccharibacteria bacterium]